MGYFQILCAVAIWAWINGILVKSCKISGVGVGFWTALVGLSIYAVDINQYAWGFRILDRTQIWGLIFLGLFAAINNACYYTALKISISNAALFHYLAPMLTVIWSLVPIFEIQVTSLSVMALLGGFAGIVYITGPNLKEKNWKLILLGSASAIFYSLEIVLSGYVSKELGVPALISTFTKLFFQALVMLTIAVVFRESFRVKLGDDSFKLVLGGIALYLSFVFYFNGSATVGDLERGILSYIDRIGAIVLGAWWFEEERKKITKNVWIGGALILGSSLLILI